ncbi:MAG: hypothetical protein U0987_15605 [Afipia sp.]|nr:hypothetical protein [Afipia sp.]
MTRTVTIAAIAGLALGGLAGAYTSDAWPLLNRSGAQAPKSQPAWAEVQWPFPTDEWGKGKAFRCAAANCGVEVNLYIRAKIGFCNCTTGVSDDDELARLSDFNLMGEKPSATGPGRPISVRWMRGRSRGYTVTASGWTRRSSLAVAFNDRCDAIVATAIVGNDRPAAVEAGVIEFLNSDTIAKWAEVAIGL